MMTFNIACLGLLAAQSAFSRVIEPRAKPAAQLRTDKPINCWNQVDPVGGDEGKADCIRACAGAPFVSGLVHNYASNTVNGCEVAIVQLQKHEIEGHDFTDACTQLVNNCSNYRAAAEFQGTRNSKAKGTMEISYQPIQLPDVSGHGAPTTVTKASGDYSVKLVDCQSALQNGWLGVKPKPGHGLKGVVATQGNCNITGLSDRGAPFSPADAVNSATDVFKIPDVCNTQGFCRESVIAGAGDGASGLDFAISAIF